MSQLPGSNLPEDIQQGMTWLAKKFSEIMNDPAQDAEDIYQDLWVTFLEKQQNAPIDVKNPKDFWFITFRNALIDKARNARLNQDRLEVLKRELAHVEENCN